MKKTAVLRDFQLFPNLKISIIVNQTYPIVLIFTGFHPGIHCNKKISQVEIISQMKSLNLCFL